MSTKIHKILSLALFIALILCSIWGLSQHLRLEAAKRNIIVLQELNNQNLAACEAVKGLEATSDSLD